MRIAWIGFHQEGLPALDALLRQRIDVAAVITLQQDAAQRRSGAVDFDELCHQYNIPLHRIRHINDADSIELLRSLELDIAFVIGWSQIVGSEALNSTRLGMIGAHASLLPRNRGSAPINWSIIRGERETGNSLIWLAENVDQGDLIDQRVFDISAFDTCESLYGKVAKSNRDMILDVIPKLAAGIHVGRQQPKTNEPLLPRRRPEDGLVDWTQPVNKVYDFVRALTHPYPGAFSYLDGEHIQIWKAASVPLPTGSVAPGMCAGAVTSPESAACGQLVACADGFLNLLEVEDETGRVWSGPELATLDWSNKHWTNEQSISHRRAS